MRNLNRQWCFEEVLVLWSVWGRKVLEMYSESEPEPGQEGDVQPFAKAARSSLQVMSCHWAGADDPSLEAAVAGLLRIHGTYFDSAGAGRGVERGPKTPIDGRDQYYQQVFDSPGLVGSVASLILLARTGPDVADPPEHEAR